jgi:hypothetical protein
MDSVRDDQLQPKTEAAKRAIDQALDAASGVDLDDIDTGEIIRIEEALVMASKAAKEVVSLRLRRRNDRTRLGRQGASRETSQETADQGAQHRVFEDYKGTRWHAFAVYPAYANTEPASLPAAYREGWLAFRSETEMRRVAPLPLNWNELSIEELRELCHKAQSSTKRTQSADRTAQA